MSTYTVTDPRKVTTKRVQTMKQQGEKIVSRPQYLNIFVLL